MLKFLARPTLMAITTGGSDFRSVGAAAGHRIVTGWCGPRGDRAAPHTASADAGADRAPDA